MSNPFPNGDDPKHIETLAEFRAWILRQPEGVKATFLDGHVFVEWLPARMAVPWWDYERDCYLESE